jgi:L-ascorbate metabolism protein UlaG (beta-lactamase superfamily)
MSYPLSAISDQAEMVWLTAESWPLIAQRTFTMLRYLIAGLALAAISFPGVAQEKKFAQLRWYGHSYFMLTTSAGTKVAFDPHAISEYGAPTIAPDIVVISHNHDDHNRKEVFSNADSKDLKAFYGVIAKGKGGDWAKIDEKVKDVRIRNVGVYHDEEEGAKRGKNSVMIVEADGMVFCHLGDLGHELSEEQVKAIGPVDVLMIPVGGIYTINGETAKKVVAQLKPKLFIVPMHYGTTVYTDVLPPDEFLEGQKRVDKLEGSNVLEIPLGLKKEQPSVVLLGWKELKK